MDCLFKTRWCVKLANKLGQEICKSSVYAQLHLIRFINMEVIATQKTDAYMSITI